MVLNFAVVVVVAGIDHGDLLGREMLDYVL